MVCYGEDFTVVGVAAIVIVGQDRHFVGRAVNTDSNVIFDVIVEAARGDGGVISRYRYEGATMGVLDQSVTEFCGQAYADLVPPPVDIDLIDRHLAWLFPDEWRRLWEGLATAEGGGYGVYRTRLDDALRVEYAQVPEPGSATVWEQWWNGWADGLPGVREAASVLVGTPMGVDAPPEVGTREEPVLISEWLRSEIGQPYLDEPGEVAQKLRESVKAGESGKKSQVVEPEVKTDLYHATVALTRELVAWIGRGEASVEQAAKILVEVFPSLPDNSLHDLNRDFSYMRAPVIAELWARFLRSLSDLEPKAVANWMVDMTGKGAAEGAAAAAVAVLVSWNDPAAAATVLGKVSSMSHYTYAAIVKAMVGVEGSADVLYHLALTKPWFIARGVNSVEGGQAVTLATILISWHVPPVVVEVIGAAAREGDAEEILTAMATLAGGAEILHAVARSESTAWTVSGWLYSTARQSTQQAEAVADILISWNDLVAVLGVLKPPPGQNINIEATRNRVVKAMISRMSPEDAIRLQESLSRAQKEWPD